MTATTKQIAFAAKLFARHADIAARHGAPLTAKTFEQDMIWLELNPQDRRDVSTYIDIYANARNEARMMRRS